MMSEGIKLEPIPRPKDGAAAATSSLTQLRRRHQELARDTKDFAIPGYGGLLVATYRRLDADIALELMSKAGEDAVASNADLLIRSCAQIVELETLEGQPTVLTKAGSQSGYDRAVAAALGVEVESARDVVIAAVFARNGLAVNDHANEVWEWMRAGHREADRRLLGESKARRP